MTATADMIIERRRVRRSLMIWRIAAIVAVVVAVLAMLPVSAGHGGDHVARVEIKGMILDDPDREKMIRELAKNDDVQAVMVRINSPGGTVVASEALYEALRHVADTKPVVSVMSEYAASGGYITAIAGDHIVARGNTLTGSIGVVAQIPNVEGLLSILGVEVTEVKSAPLKAEPSFTQSPSPEALAAQESLILDMFAWFEGLVSDRRSLTGGALDDVTDGRAFTGRQALQLGLVDALGDEDTARAWLEDTHEISTDLPTLTHDWREDDRPWPLSGLQDAAAALGWPEVNSVQFPRLFALIQ